MKKTPKQSPITMRESDACTCRWKCPLALTMRELAVATLREYESAEVAERINKIEFGFFLDEKGTSELRSS
jgi:hypothetical protein